jgi:hypothetical protein
MATKKDRTIIYLGLAAFFIYWLNKKKPINIPSISPSVNPPIQKTSPGIQTGGALTTPGGSLIETGKVYTSFPAPPDQNYTPVNFNPGPVDIAPVDPVYLTDYAIKSNETGTPPDPYFYPNDIFQDDIFTSPVAPSDPYSVTTLPTTGVQQLIPSYAMIKDMNPNNPMLNYDCQDCKPNQLSGYMKPVPNIC